MNFLTENLTSAGIIGCLLAGLVLLAGAGFWRFSVSMIGALVIAAALGAGAGALVWRIAHALQLGGGSGEWRGLGALVFGAITAALVGLISFIVALFVLGKSLHLLRRGTASRVVLGVGAVLLAGSVGALVCDQPSFATTELLVRKIVSHQASPEDEAELVRRGAAAVPVILAKVHTHPISQSAHFAPSQVPPLLHVLGKIGGPEAVAELHQWAEGDVYEGIRVAALEALAALGDRSIIPLLATLLEKRDSPWPGQHAQLVRVLGELKATNQVANLRKALLAQPQYGSPQLTETGIAALAAIGTDEAWAVIAELAADREKSRRDAVLTALQKIPGPRTVALAAKALDDPDPRVRESAYWLIYRVEPKLLEGLPSGWNEETGKKLREMLRKQGR